MQDIQVIQVKPQNLRVGFDFFILGNSANRLTTRDTRNVMIPFFSMFFYGYENDTSYDFGQTGVIG